MRRHRRKAVHGVQALMPGVLGFAGVMLLALAVAPFPNSKSSPISEVQGFGSASSQQLQTVNEIRPKKAQPDEAEVVPPELPQRVVRVPAPMDALPVTKAQPVPGSAPRTSPVRSTDTSPIRIAVVSNLTDPALAASVTAALNVESGVQAYQTAMAELDRPDVLLILNTSTAGASVWYCGPAPNESSALASALVPAAAPLGAEPDDAIGTAVDEALSCATLHAGRGRMAGVNLRLPTNTIGQEELTRVVREGVRSYLDTAAARIRRNRDSIEVVWPAFGPITSHYGPDHALGIDIGQWEGDVVAATEGIVTFAGGDACCSYGLYVIIENEAGVTTLYGHLDALYVKEGDRVRPGRPLGPAGNTGHSSGTHLHFETLVNGVRVNPLNVLP